MAQFPDAPTPGGGRESRVGLALHFHRGEKNKVYIVTAVDRATRCIIGWDVVWERTPEALQAVVDQGCRARQYYLDQWSIYQLLVYYPGKHTVSEGKAETFSVEGDNADLRHYFARLVRRSGCFSRCIQALWNAVKLFVHCYNQRQIRKHKYSQYPIHGFHFVNPT